MTKIEFDMDSLRASALPSLDKTINSMDELIKKCSLMYIPRSFKYRTYLMNLLYDNAQIKKSVVSVKELIYNTNNSYNNLLNTINYNARTLNSVQIGKKYSSIK